MWQCCTLAGKIVEPNAEALRLAIRARQSDSSRSRRSGRSNELPTIDHVTPAVLVFGR
jgi:hypothetical protein